jgi:hypothetical protein
LISSPGVAYSGDSEKREAQSHDASILMKTHRKPAAENPLVKVSLELPEGSPAGGESLWAEKLAEDKYRLRNSPFYAYGYSFWDVVAAEEAEGLLKVKQPIIRGGHSTYRVFLAEGLGAESQEFIAAWQPLKRLGCSYEGAWKRLLAIDVPPAADISQVYCLLEKGEKAGIWQFEEGYCGSSPHE